MIFFCCCRSSTASSPAHSASADLPVPARPPSETMPTSGSISRSIAMRCSAERPCSPNTSRSPRTSRYSPSPVTRPSAEPRSEWMIRPVLTGQPAHFVARGDLGLVEVADVVARDVDRGDARPARIHRLLGEVLLRGDAEGCRLDAHRKVLGDDRDLLAVLGEVHRDREDAAVVVTQSHAGGEHRGVGVVELDAQRAVLADRNREVEPAVLDAQLVEVTEGLAGEVADLRVVAFALELGDHHDGDHDVVLGEAEERPRIAQQHGGVQDVGAQIR